MVAFALIIGLFAGMLGWASGSRHSNSWPVPCPASMPRRRFVRVNNADFGGRRVGTLFVPPIGTKK